MSGDILKRRRGVFVLTSHRGRGKSTCLLIAALLTLNLLKIPEIQIVIPDENFNPLITTLEKLSKFLNVEVKFSGNVAKIGEFGQLRFTTPFKVRDSLIPLLGQRTHPFVTPNDFNENL